MENLYDTLMFASTYERVEAEKKVGTFFQKAVGIVLSNLGGGAKGYSINKQEARDLILRADLQNWSIDEFIKQAKFKAEMRGSDYAQMDSSLTALKYSFVPVVAGTTISVISGTWVPLFALCIIYALCSLIGIKVQSFFMNKGLFNLALGYFHKMK